MLARICALITALVLTACGGGGGDAGTPSLGGGGVAALFTSAASAVNLEVGRAGDYSISGGKSPYTVSSSDLAVASVGLQGTAGFVISGVKGGSATVTVKDAAGAAVSIAVTVGSNTPLFSSAPSAVSLVVGSSQSYQISGGAAPYAVSSADVSVASAMLATSGSGFTVTAAKAGATRVVVTDAKGSTVPVDVTVSAGTTPIALYTTAASPVVIAIGTTPVYTVGGGTAPYAVTSSNEAVAKAVVTSQSLSVSGLSAGSAVIQVTDAVGARSSISVTVGSASVVALYTTAPPALTMVKGSAEQKFAIGGGVGPYTASSGNSSVVSARVVGTELYLNPMGLGSAGVSVFDSAGRSVPVVVTVVVPQALTADAPDFLNLAPGGARDFTVSGGLPPYSISTTDAAVVSVAKRTADFSAFSLAGVSSGSATVSIADSAGTKRSIAVTVASKLALYVAAPTTVDLPVGSVQEYDIGGGTAPYTVSSGSPGVVKAEKDATGLRLKLMALATGTASVQVRDAAGSTVSQVVSVAPAVALSTTAPSSITVAPGAVQDYGIAGGVAPYSAVSDNTAIANAAVVGSTSLRVNGVDAGSTTVKVRDSLGVSINVQVQVSAQAVLPISAAPTAASGTVGDTVAVTISGGRPGYTYVSGNPSVATVASSASGFTATLLRAGQATVVVRDAAGQVREVTVLASNPAVGLFTSAPAVLTLSAGSQRSFAIAGGLPPYTVHSDNNGFLVASQPSPGVLQLDAQATSGQASVTIRDSTGASVSLAATVGSSVVLFTSAPPTLVVSTGITRTFEILGGTAPYFSRSTDESAAVVSNAGSVLSIRGVGPGTATAAIRDSLGASVNVAVTVGSTIPLYTAAPPNVRLAVGEQSSVFAIAGGAPPYTVTTANANVFTVSQPTSGTFRLQGVSPGAGASPGTSVAATIKDAVGATVTVNVIVGPAIPLFTTAPSDITIGLGAANEQTYQIRGGTPPYLAAVTTNTASGAPISARIGASGGTLIIQGLTAGTAQVLLTDSLGDRVTTTVSVSGSATAPLTVSPAAVTGAVGDSLNFVIQGGLPGAVGYTASVVNQNVATALSTGANSFRVNLTRVGQTDVTVVDSLGQVQVVTVTAQPSASALFTSAPASITFTNGVAQSFTVGGGTGTYSFQSSNLAVASVGAPGSTLVVTPQGVGSASVTVSDSSGTQVSFNVTVQAAIPLATSAPPAGVTLSPSATPTDYEILGGRSTYTVSSSNQTVATVQVTGASSNVLSITPVAAGSATVVVTDAAGTRVLVPVTVSPSGVLALTVTPESAGGTVGDVLTFTVSGGTPASGNYTVRSNNTNIAIVPASASSTFSATLVNAGTTVISVFDSQGQIQNVTLNVTSAATAIRVSPSAVMLGERLGLGPNLDPNNISLSVIGGAIAGNARAFSSDLTRITPVASGRTIRLFQGIQGTLCFVPGTDTSAVTVTDLPVVITVVDDQGSSATMTVTIRNESSCP